MDIGEAIRALKDRKRVARVGWNGRGMFVFMMGATDPQDPNDPNDQATEPFLILRTAAGTLQPGWNASTPDLLADDWELVA